MHKKKTASHDEKLSPEEGIRQGEDNVISTPDGEVCFQLPELDKYIKLLEEKNRLLDETNDRLKRLQADFDNFRRRTRQEKEELSGIVTERVVTEFLPVVDNFGRALTSSTPEAGSFVTGVEMIYRQFVGVLEGLGVETIQVIGEQFDPARHEAVMRVEDPEKADGVIVEELQKGYSLRGKVIRPSMVKVVSNG
ncbi:MAG TPA: nucleotide exchange factor GrpE [Patescibacteria group bacterium]|nr:nucleotide exchange factor GrpE [Patescibacteria group bacterium]